MVNTADFKSRTTFIERKNVSTENNWGIALDIGYSTVKGCSNNMVYSFPSYARRITSPLLSFGEAENEDIQYIDNESGHMWSVGVAAQRMITSDDTRDSLQELFGRKRYNSELFKVIAEVGMGLGMLTNQYGSPVGKNVMLQTGLPPAYLRSDSDDLRQALSGSHDFSIQIGNKPFVSFKFDMPKENIFIMPQPMGTLFSIGTDNTGRRIPEAKKYFSSSVLVLDPGFGTLDIYNIRNRIVESTETFDDLGMKRVFLETSNNIMKKYKEEINVPAMQQYLDSGMIKVTNRETRSVDFAPFGDILEEQCESVCNLALEKIDNLFNNLFDHKYLIVTGGTGEAWFEHIKEHYAQNHNLEIVRGSQNDTLSSVFANVRGYYMYLLEKLKRLEKKELENQQQSQPQPSRENSFQSPNRMND